ncbi:amidase signature enzyme [Cadophora sp. DSE1049]|nr:amidase signature enzyme [Cadophora sp. DSE1049]
MSVSPSTQRIAYLARIAEVNNTFHAVTEVNPDALAIAAELDAERSTGSIRGPLHGIPILLKNLIATNDKMNNTAGSWALVGARVPRDSTVAQKLRAAGAILLGKANLSEWANARSSNSTDGYPSGSSSGSAVATALGLALGALGTETDGSIISPASFSNVVGIKPTVGLTSRYLVIPISEHQDTVGPLARTVKDAAMILKAIAGTDPRDNYTSDIPGGITPDYVAACKYSALSGVRLGIPRNVLFLSDDKYAPMIEAFEKAVNVLRHAGATIVEDTNFTAAAEFLNSNLPQVVVNADITVDLKKYFDSLTDTGQWDEALASWNNTDPRFWPAYQQNLYYGGDGGLLGAIKRHNLDAVILPSELSSDWAAAVGSPIVSVPMSSYPAGTPVVKNDRSLVESAPNMPFGLGFLGERFTERKLIGMAYAFEQRTKVRDKVPPYLKPSVELADIVWSRRSG